jgi:hypothetical protein
MYAFQERWEMLSIETTPSNTEVKNAWSYTSTLPHNFVGKFRKNMSVD